MKIFFTNIQLIDAFTQSLDCQQDRLRCLKCSKRGQLLRMVLSTKDERDLSSGNRHVENPRSVEALPKEIFYDIDNLSHKKNRDYGYAHAEQHEQEFLEGTFLVCEA